MPVTETPQVSLKSLNARALHQKTTKDSIQEQKSITKSKAENSPVLDNLRFMANNIDGECLWQRIP